MVLFVSEYVSIKKYTTHLIGWFTVGQLAQVGTPSSTSQVDVQPPFAADLQVQLTFGCIWFSQPVASNTFSSQNFGI